MQTGPGDLCLRYPNSRGTCFGCNVCPPSAEFHFSLGFLNNLTLRLGEAAKFLSAFGGGIGKGSTGRSRWGGELAWQGLRPAAELWVVLGWSSSGWGSCWNVALGLDCNGELHFLPSGSENCFYLIPWSHEQQGGWPLQSRRVLGVALCSSEVAKLDVSKLSVLKKSSFFALCLNNKRTEFWAQWEKWQMF